jgi:hypothetical protein
VRLSYDCRLSIIIILSWLTPDYSSPPTLKYAKSVEVRIGEFYRDITYKLSMNESNAALITRMLKEIPNLRSFEYVTEPRYSSTIADILGGLTTLSTLLMAHLWF